MHDRLSWHPLCVQCVCSLHCTSLCLWGYIHTNKSITCKAVAYDQTKIDDKRLRHTFKLCYCGSTHHAWSHGYPHPSHPVSPVVLITCSVVLFPPEAFITDRRADGEMPNLILSTTTQGPSITDPVVRDKVLSVRKGWQINFSPDWWAGDATLWAGLGSVSWGRETSVYK